ncbi:MAG TPA: lipoyl synthase [Waddliaceae bacterium]
MSSADLFDTRPKVKKKLNVLPENREQAIHDKAVGLGRFPSWLHRRLPKGGELGKTGDLLEKKRLHTVCEEASCPNLLECWSKKTATFLIMGKECTRSCGFCDISFAKAPKPLDEDEPQRIAESVVALGLKHVVITMVARDDISDGGALHLSKVIKVVRKQSPESTIEVLTSDFYGNKESLECIFAVQPEIFNHNIETVRELTPRVRHTATYDRTLEVLSYIAVKKRAADSPILVKSGIMVGLGETETQIHQTIEDLYDAGCSIITIGQYLQPNRHKLRVKDFIHPDQFKKYEKYGHSIGIPYMFCGPFVRSSYNANLVFKQANDRIKLIESY